MIQDLMSSFRYFPITMRSFIICFFLIGIVHKHAKTDTKKKEMFVRKLLKKMTLDEKIGQLNLLTPGSEILTGSVVSKDVELKIIQAFLKSNIDDLEKFFAAVISHHSKKWRSLPDLVIFREIAGDTNNLDLQAEKAWQALLKNSTAHDVIIVDPIAYFIVSGYGSWDRFCQERDGFYRELNHKSFIDRYITAARSGVSETPRPLAGHGVEGMVGRESTVSLSRLRVDASVSYTHLTLPTIYSV